MTNSADILKSFIDGSMRAVAWLPEPIFALPLRLAGMLVSMTLACGAIFQMGSRASALQLSVACLAAFLSALLPVEQLSAWAHSKGSTVCAFVLALTALVLFFLPILLPRFLVSRVDLQAYCTRLIYRAELALLVLNIIVVICRHIFG